MCHTPATTQKILVADDDRTTRHAISRMLRDANYAVTAAKDGIDALRKVQQMKFDLVFLDIWMPGISGLEVLACIRSGKSHPKVIIMTSDTTPQSLLRAVREQAYEYISKPFPPKEAVEVAQRARKKGLRHQSKWCPRSRTGSSCSSPAPATRRSASKTFC